MSEDEITEDKTSSFIIKNKDLNLINEDIQSKL